MQGIPVVSSSRQVVAVASGKGGVGKSTVTTNLAVALSQQGLSVGLLDADIYGPSQQHMLGVADNRTPDQQDGEFLLPIEAYGLKTMSICHPEPVTSSSRCRNVRRCRALSL
jgi:ATP-binding protein involved in chromosome partitioning